MSRIKASSANPSQSGEKVTTMFRLEPLGPEHNDRDYEAWMSSIDHIHATPGMEHRDWPTPMSLGYWEVEPI